MPETEREKGKGVLETFGIEERDFFGLVRLSYVS